MFEGSNLMKKTILTLFIISLLGGSVMAKTIQQPFQQGEINPYNKFFTGTT